MEAVLTFDLRTPGSLPEALAALAAGGRALGGGTDLVPNLRRGLDQPATLVSLERLPGFQDLADGEAGLTLGAGVTLARLAADAAVRRRYPALAQAAEAVAGPGHRSAATLAGNLCQDTRCVYYNQSEWWRAANGWCLKRKGTVCHVAPQGKRCNAAYSGDVAPALLALGAEVELVARQGSRRLPLAQLFRDDGAAHLALDPGEIVARVHVPAPAAGTVSGYRKGRTRGAMDFPLAGVAIALSVDGGRLAALRVGVSGTNSLPFVLEGTDALLGQAVDDDAAAALGKLVSRQVSPARTTVTPSNHRRLVASALAQRLLRELAAGDAA